MRPELICYLLALGTKDSQKDPLNGCKGFRGKSQTFGTGTRTLKQRDRWPLQGQQSWQEWGGDRVLDGETRALTKNDVLPTA